MCIFKWCMFVLMTFLLQVSIMPLNQLGRNVSYARGIFHIQQKALFTSPLFHRLLPFYHVGTPFTIIACSSSPLRTKLKILHAFLVPWVRVKSSYACSLCKFVNLIFDIQILSVLVKNEEGGKVMKFVEHSVNDEGEIC